MNNKDNNSINKNDKEEENEDVVEIDPDDLFIIKDKKNWKPSKAMILEYATQLGYKKTDPEEILKIAEKYLTCDLPDNLERAFTKEDYRILYIDIYTNDITYESDLETKAKEEFEKCRNKYKSNTQTKNDFDEKDQTNQEPKKINNFQKILNNEIEKNKKLLNENRQLKQIVIRNNTDLNNLKAKIETLKSENEKFKNDLMKAKDITLNYQKKQTNLENQLNLKEKIFLDLEKKINNNINNNPERTKYDLNDIIVVKFVSTDYNIQEGIKCSKSDVFAEVEEKLYQKYGNLRNTNNYFTVNSLPILRFKKLSENKIKDGDKIQLFKMK